MSGWRVWFAFEVKPGITLSSTRDMRKHWLALFESCRGPNQATEYLRWADLLVDYSHAWGSA